MKQISMVGVVLVLCGCQATLGDGTRQPNQFRGSCLLSFRTSVVDAEYEATLCVTGTPTISSGGGDVTYDESSEAVAEQMAEACEAICDSATGSGVDCSHEVEFPVDESGQDRETTFPQDNGCQEATVLLDASDSREMPTTPTPANPDPVVNPLPGVSAGRLVQVSDANEVESLTLATALQGLGADADRVWYGLNRTSGEGVSTAVLGQPVPLGLETSEILSFDVAQNAVHFALVDAAADGSASFWLAFGEDAPTIIQRFSVSPEGMVSPVVESKIEMPNAVRKLVAVPGTDFVAAFDAQGEILLAQRDADEKPQFIEVPGVRDLAVGTSGDTYVLAGRSVYLNDGPEPWASIGEEALPGELKTIVKEQSYSGVLVFVQNGADVAVANVEPAGVLPLYQVSAFALSSSSFAGQSLLLGGIEGAESALKVVDAPTGSETAGVAFGTGRVVACDRTTLSREWFHCIVED